MKEVIVLLSVVTILCLTCPIEVSAQQGMLQKGSGEWGMGKPYGRMYNRIPLRRSRARLSLSIRLHS